VRWCRRESEVAGLGGRTVWLGGGRRLVLAEELSKACMLGACSTCAKPPATEGGRDASFAFAVCPPARNALSLIPAGARRFPWPRRCS